MKKINLLLTLSSLNVLLVTAERFSFTTKILLEPYQFLRLHELVQMILLILFTVLIPVLVFKEITRNFEVIKQKKVQWLGLLFIIGIYFYSTGNGLHEVASFLFNQYCPVNSFTTPVCGSMFFNDYYTGNIFYFFGAYLMSVPLILLERMFPNRDFTPKDLRLTYANALVYALAVFAYAAFDRVLVGLVFSLLMMVTVDFLFIQSRKKPAEVPFTTHTVVAYTLGTVASLFVRFL